MSNTTAVIADPRTSSYVSYEPDFLDSQHRTTIRAEIAQHSDAFEAGTMLVEGRELPTPRLVLAFGDKPYRYPDLRPSLTWPPSMASVRERLAKVAGHHFNYALVNFYRDGRDFTGWHADKMHLHVPGTSIAVLSLGAVRPLRFRSIGSTDAAAEVPLEDGSLLWMRGETQAHYEHSIPADDRPIGTRLSVTFRHVLEPHAA